MRLVAAATSPRRRDVQGLRAVAVAAVVLFHAGFPLAGGYLGVDVFFVVSGLVITGLLLREHEREGRLDLGRFYARRFRRLVPALALVVVITLAVSAWVLSPIGAQQTAALTGVAALAFGANVVIARRSGDYFGAPAETNPLLHTWSLSVEEQFYLVYPALLLVGFVLYSRRRSHLVQARLGRRALLQGIAVASGASLLLAVAGSVGLVSSQLLVGFYSPVPRAWEFGLGAALAVAASGPAPRWWGHGVVAPLGVILLTAALVVPSGGSAAQLPMTALATAGSGLLLASGTTPTRSRPVTVLSSRALVALGDRSYSVYLWHWPFIVLAGIVWPHRAWVAPLAALAALPVAFAAFRWVEDPLRHARTGAAVSLLRLAPAVLIPPVVVAGAVVARAPQVTAEPQMSEAVAAMSTSAVAVGGCDTDTLAWCTWPAEQGSRPVYLVGDSHAGHLSDGVRAAAAAVRRDTRATMAYNCPVLLHLELRLRGDSGPCATRNAELVSELLSSPPGTVLLAASDVYWSSPEWALSRQGRQVEDEADRLQAVGSDVEALVGLLRGAGHEVVLVQSVPLHADFAWEACSLTAIRERACTDEVSVSEARVAQGGTRLVVAKAAAASGADVLDPWTTLCDGVTCPTTRDGVALYRNWSHLTVRGSEGLTPSLTELLRG